MKSRISILLYAKFILSLLRNFNDLLME